MLLVCIGRATKLADDLQRHEKEYLAGVVFGATTPSYDREKDIDRRYGTEGVSETALREVLPTFRGEQEQVAPLFSAKSVDGVRAYELARKAYKAALRGETEFDHSAAELLTRQRIRITEMELVAYGGCELCEGAARGEGAAGTDAALHGVEGRVNPKIHVIPLEGLDLPCALVRVTCSKGTYIRALARDLGEALGSGAFLGSLRRTRTGGFRVEDSLSPDEVLAALGPRGE